MRNTRRISIITSLILTMTVPAHSASDAPTTSELVERSEVKFIPLNPLRGDRSPRSGKLWGNIREGDASGMLVKFADGFQSPPHIHNITYRAVVIDGHIHNDDPTAAKMWMGPGSFWTQPKGENHITAAKGKDATIFLEILSGPYLVKPADEAFDAGERPVNIDARNIVWLNSTDSNWIKADGPRLAHLWGKTTGQQKNGSLLKIPSKYNGSLSTTAPLIRVVTIKGTVDVRMSGNSSSRRLNPGSYFGSRGAAKHQLSCVSDDACVLYVHVDGKYQLSSP